jgi:hypothetical protein
VQPNEQHQEKLGRKGPRPSIFKTSRPTTINKKAIAKRAQPGSVIPRDFFRSQAVNGHAEMPENKANQPLVSGHGPRVIMSPKPPLPAMIVHAQATNEPSVRASFLAHGCQDVCSTGSAILAMGCAKSPDGFRFRQALTQKSGGTGQRSQVSKRRAKR